MGTQIVVIYAGTNGYIDKVDVKSVVRWEREFIEFLNAKHPTLVSDIETKKALDDELKKRIDEVVKAFNSVFQA